MAKASSAQFTHDDAASYRPDARPSVQVSTTLMGSRPSSRNRASPIRTIPLQRGEACLNCRRRKMKCDAGKPSCSSCTRVGKADACEYEETPFLATISALEEQVRELQARVRELESDGSPLPTPSSGFTAFLPTNSPTLSDENLSPRSAHSPMPQYEAPTLGRKQDLSEQWSPYSPDDLDFPTDVQPHILQQLISLFVPHANQFGLSTTSMSLLGRHTALTFAACAAASAITSHSPESERAFILRADAALARSAARPDTADVQASAILAQLAFARGRALEGHRYLGSAIRVARALNVDDQTWAMVARAERIAAVQPEQTQLQDQTPLFEKQPTTWFPDYAYGNNFGGQ